MLFALTLLAPAFAQAPEPPAPARVCIEDHTETPEEAPSVHQEHLSLQYGLQFLPEAAAHHLAARTYGVKDAYLGAELRYMPQSDVLWSGRVGAGLDLLGGGNTDLTLGLFLGSAGQWDHEQDRAVLYSNPIAGAEVAFGLRGERLYGRYRWLVGWGAQSAVDQQLTENELTVGYRVVGDVDLYGQYLRLNPGEAVRRSGIGMGVRLMW